MWLPSIVWDGTTDNSINMTYDNDFRNNNKGIKYLILEKLPINKMYVYIITLSK